MGKLTSKSDIRTLTFLGFILYFASYVTRINYGAIISEFVNAEGVSRPSAAILTTVTFITYGLGQLLSGYLGDRISPRLLIFYGFIATILMNLLLPLFSPNITAMAVIWGLNGLAQAFMWPPLVKILASALRDEDYSRCISKVILSSGFGTVAVYVTAPVIIKLFGWKYVFSASALFGAAVAVLWITLTSKLLKNVSFTSLPEPSEARNESNLTEKDIAIHKAVKIMLPVILISNAVQGMLRDGITTWMPSFISDTFELGSAVSILTGVALPIFHIICNILTFKVLRVFKNDVFFTISVFFSLVTVLLLLLLIFGTETIIVGLLLISLSAGFVHGINALQTCYVPIYFKTSGKISLISGVINFGVYVGSAISTYLFAVISEKHGWNATIISWVIFAFSGVVLTVMCLAKIQHNIKKQ